ncbi:uncharacterized protein [Asterias amurensis]|uniref:uncharacterized protein n=1 Tax=Asterias amurensis TaxID=7602 RepID=UPI003AB30D1D
MVNGLLDCLKEANLAQYTTNFLQQGVSSLDVLSSLTIQEYSQFGITDLADKKRLFRLIHIVKSVQSHKGKNDKPEGQGGSVSRRKGNRSLEDFSVKGHQGTSSSSQRNTQPSSLNNSWNISERSPRTNMNKFQPEGLSSQKNSSNQKISEDSLLSVARKELKKGTLSPGTLRKLETQGGILFVKSTTSTSPKLSRRKPSAKKKLPLRESLSDSEVGDSDFTDASSMPINSTNFGAPQILKRSFIGVIDHLDGSVYNYGIPDQEQRSSTRHQDYQGIQGTSSDAGERIKVCVRKRPLNKKEERENEVDVVQTEGRGTVVMNEAKVAVDLTKFMQVHKYHFDEVFSESCKNEEVYARTAKPLISTMFNRGKATCFAYGQTGAGKTYTMLGNSVIKGLYLLAAEDIFATLNASRKSGNELAVWASYFEIYCGQLFDLLNDRQRVHAREDSQHRVCIAGIREVQVSGTQSLMQVVEQGNKLRSKGVSGVNADSSRSHAILQLQLQDGGRRKLGRFSFIDLAGSERACDTVDPDKVTRYEGAEINTSLLALKECIRALDQEQRHTPFRQSKLTQVLRDSFLGHSRTCMIANIAPNGSAVDHTLNTLRYADRVKELKKETSSHKQVSPYPSTPNTFSPGTTSTPLKNPNSKQMQPSLKTQVTTPGPRPTKGVSTPTSASSQTPGNSTAKKAILVRKVSTEKAFSKSLNQSSSSRPSRRPDESKQSNISTENYQNKRNRENSTGRPKTELSDTKVHQESTRRPLSNVKKNLNVTFDRSVTSSETPSKRDEEVKAQTKEAFLQGNPLPVWYPPEEVDQPPKVPSKNPGDTWDIENPRYIYSPKVQRATPSARSPPPRDAKEKKLNTPELPSRNKTPNLSMKGEKEEPMSDGQQVEQSLPDQESGFLADDELTDNWAKRNSSSSMKHGMRTQYSDTSCSTDTESTIELLAEIDYALRNSLVSPISDNGISDNQPVKKDYPTFRTSQVGVDETPKRSPRNRTKSAPQPKLFPECQPVTSGSTSPPRSSVLVQSQYVMSLHPEIRINDSPDSMSTDSLQELEAERHLRRNRQIPDTRLGNTSKSDQIRSPLYRSAPLQSQGSGSALKSSKMAVKGKESHPSTRGVSVSSGGQNKTQSPNNLSKSKEPPENPSGVIVSTSFHDFLASAKPHESIQSGQPMVLLSKSDHIRPSPIGQTHNSAAINPAAKNSKGSTQKGSTGLQSPITVEVLRGENRSSAFSPISGIPRYNLPSPASNLASTPNKAFMKESLVASQQSPISKEIVYQQPEEGSLNGQHNQCNEGDGEGPRKVSSSPEDLVPRLQLAGVTSKNGSLLSPRHVRQNSAIERAKELLVSAHAEQIGELERLCEREWRLIKQLHSGEKGLSEYLQYAKDLMNSKLRCIDTFNDQLSSFNRCSTPEMSPRSRSPMEAC